MKIKGKILLDRILTLLFFLLLISALGLTFYKFYYLKNYEYLVEAPCDPDSEVCFQRDCETSPDDCPPNGLSDYKQFHVTAKDFFKCSDDSCVMECSSGAIDCEQILCGDSPEDMCSGPLPEALNQ